LRRLIAYTFLSCLGFLLTSFTGLRRETGGVYSVSFTSNLRTTHDHLISVRASLLYDEMNLKDLGLSDKAFTYAYKGYQHLLDKKLISQPGYLTICDFSQSAKQKRLYIIDMAKDTVLMNTYVAHGHNSGGEYATRFSNRPRSKQSSLGFYITTSTYMGEHGLSLRMEGLEPGFNDKAYRRGIVVHGANYIGGGHIGRSFGCPAVPKKESKAIINMIKDGSCLFIYNPQKKYIDKSKILND